MIVTDLRSIFSKRNIELFDVTSSFIYYAEEKNENGHHELFILEYNRSTRKERLITNYTLEDPTFVEHMFAFENTIVIVLENGSNSMWLIEADKLTGNELNRRKVVCTGTFRNCMALDSSHLLIYMGPDEANAAMFKQYSEITGCECLCYLYDMKKNVKHFVKNPLIAKLGISNMRKTNAQGRDYLILLDPFGDEDIKKSYYDEQRWISADIRDNVWLCELSRLEAELESGVENISKKCIASADIKGLARYMGIDGDKVFFRAKEFRTGNEKLCSYDIALGKISVETGLEIAEHNDPLYVVEEKPFTMFALRKNGEGIYVKGVVNSNADLSFAPELGSFMTCMDGRYVITKNTKEESGVKNTLYRIYDSVMKKSESYNCNCYISGNTLVLY